MKKMEKPFFFFTNGNPYDLNSLGDIEKLAIPFGFCLQTADKSRG